MLENGVQGKLNVKGIWGIIVEILGNELKKGISNIVVILIIVVIHSILKAIIENLGNNQTSQVAYFIQYLLIVSAVISNFGDLLIIAQNSINEIIEFMRMFIPLLISLIITTGSITTSGATGSILIFLINILGSIIETVILPLIMIGTTLSIVSSFSDKVHITRLSKLIKKSTVWILGIILTIFVCILGIEGTLSSSVDGMTAKTAKAAISNFIPVVGKIMGDTVDTVIGCANILKNAVGVIGLIVLIGIVAVPIIKVTIMWSLMCIVSGISETIADEKIVKLLDEVAESYKLLFGILVSVSFMFIIGITLVLRITNISAT